MSEPDILTDEQIEEFAGRVAEFLARLKSTVTLAHRNRQIIATIGTLQQLVGERPEPAHDGAAHSARATRKAKAPAAPAAKSKTTKSAAAPSAKTTKSGKANVAGAKKAAGAKAVAITRVTSFPIDDAVVTLLRSRDGLSGSQIRRSVKASEGQFRASLKRLRGSGAVRMVGKRSLSRYHLAGA